MEDRLLTERILDQLADADHLREPVWPNCPVEPRFDRFVWLLSGGGHRPKPRFLIPARFALERLQRSNDEGHSEIKRSADADPGAAQKRAQTLRRDDLRHRQGR